MSIRKSVLVTGGAGFLGSHLCDRLIADGHEVLCVDNFFTGTRQNIEHLIGHPRFELLRHDVTFPLYVEVDEIYNLACPASPIHYQHDPVQTTKTSILGAINMLGLAKRLKCRIFQASTSEVYGDPIVHPQREDYWGNVNPVGLRSCYDEGKRCAETLFFDYHRQHRLSIKVARIFNTYGPRMHPSDGRVVSNFIIQALKGEPITIYGDGSQTRSFCYVDDLVEGFVRFMGSRAELTGPVNLGNPNEFSIAELARLAIEHTGSRSRLTFVNLPADDPKQRQPDITLARTELDWEPRIQLVDGLKRTIEYFDRLLSDSVDAPAMRTIHHRNPQTLSTFTGGKAGPVVSQRGPAMATRQNGAGAMADSPRQALTSTPPAATRAPAPAKEKHVRICMIGAGYVGLVSAACFSEFGWHVQCVDKDPGKIERLHQGEIPIYEPGLDDLVHRNVAMGRLSFSTDIATAVKGADIVFLAVGTPMRRGDGHADLSFIFSAVDEVAPHMSGFTVITTKSTVPVGTSRRIEERLRALRPDLDFAVCSNPEFLREGSAIQDFMHPDRILIGCDEPRAEALMRRLYKPVTLDDKSMLVTGREAAELSKYAANAFLAMKISFINEMADLCERVGANVQELATAVGRDARIGDKFLMPGPGYGGSCFPKDVAAVIRSARESGSPLSIIEAVQHFNEERKIEMARRIRTALGGSLSGKRIGVLGITFKADTDDIREAASLTILPILTGEGAIVHAYDPQGRVHAESQLPSVLWTNAALDVADGADAVIVLTEWNEFRAIELKDLRARMRGNVLMDLRNLFLPAEAQAAGLAYYSIGRAAPVAPAVEPAPRPAAAASRNGSYAGGAHI